MSHITITIPVTKDTAKLVKELLDCVKVEDTDTIRASELKEETVAQSAKKGKSKKAQEPEEDLEELESEEEDAEEVEVEEDEELIEEELIEEDEDEDGAVNDKQLSQLKIALKVYSGKHGKEKAVKQLNKFAKTSSNVKAKDLPKLLKALKV